MAYHLCIEVSSMSAPLAADDSETHILHVEFYGTGRDDYRVSYDKLERTLLTEYLKQADGPDFHKKLMKLAFDFSPTDKTNLFCRSVLERGIFCRQRVYFFLGHSDEQLKKKSCFMMSASHEKIHELLALLSRCFYPVVAWLLRCCRSVIALFFIVVAQLSQLCALRCCFAAVFALLSRFGSFIFLFNSCSSFFLLFWDASIS